MTSRALVLGGGGPVGIAWESGLLTGLAEAGVDLAQADFILGTSAGAFVGARLAMGVDVLGLAAPFLTARDAPPKPTAARPAGPPPDLSALTRATTEILRGERPAQDVRAELGAWAADASAMSEEDFIQSFGRFLAELPDDAWPERGFACGAVDIADGTFRLWDKAAGVGLARAVASSCSVPGVHPPVTVKERRYMDGGARSATNADLAQGYDRVVVIAVRVDGGQAGVFADRLRARLAGELQVLRDAGVQVELVTPDAASLTAFGVNLMDPARRPAAAQAGLDQGRAAAAALRALWSG
jgi:NTE family protein